MGVVMSVFFKDVGVQKNTCHSTDQVPGCRVMSLPDIISVNKIVQDVVGCEYVGIELLSCDIS